MKNLNKLCFILCLICIMILATTIDIVGQYKEKTNSYTVGIIGLSGLPIAFIASEINYGNFTRQFGEGSPYMGDNKASAYNTMMDKNNSILITGALITVAGIVIQHFINTRRTNKNKRCYN